MLLVYEPQHLDAGETSLMMFCLRAAGSPLAGEPRLMVVPIEDRPRRAKLRLTVSDAGVSPFKTDDLPAYTTHTIWNRGDEPMWVDLRVWVRVP